MLIEFYITWKLLLEDVMWNLSIEPCDGDDAAVWIPSFR
jgi:hypothetical protein